MFVKYIINIVVNNASRITILKQGILEIGIEWTSIKWNLNRWVNNDR